MQGLHQSEPEKTASNGPVGGFGLACAAPRSASHAISCVGSPAGAAVLPAGAEATGETGVEAGCGACTSGGRRATTVWFC